MEAAMIEHKIMISFLASKVLTADEMSELERAVAAQVEEPQITDEDGELVDADFDISNVLVDFLISGAPTD